MTTLAEVSGQLKKQNDILTDTNKDISALSSSLTTFVKNMISADETDKLKNLEIERENTVKETQSDARDTEQRVSNKGGGLFGSLRDLLAGGLGFGALAAFASGLFAKVFNWRNLARLAILAFADELTNAISNEFGIEDSETKKQIRNAIQGAGIGSIFGRRFLVLGGLLGGLVNKETSKEFDKIGEEFRKFGDSLEEPLDDLSKELNTLLGVNVDLHKILSELEFNPLNFALRQITQGLQSLNELISGEPGKDLQDQAMNFVEIAEGLLTAYLGYRFGKRIIFRKPDPRAPKPPPPVVPNTPQNFTPRTGQVLKFNGVKYEWKGAQWVIQSGQKSGGKVATSAVASELTKRAAQGLPWYLRAAAFAAKGLNLASLLAFSENVGEGSELNGRNYSFLDKMDTGNIETMRGPSASDYTAYMEQQSNNITAIPSKNAAVLAQEATIAAETARITQPVIIQDNSTKTTGGTSGPAPVIVPPASTSDSRDPVGRD